MSVKVDLRLHFLRSYHEGDARVFDACQGSGHVWKEVRKHFCVKSYWGTDKKKKPGRLAVDSSRLLARGVSDNVVDIDTYGSPFDHWLNMLPYVNQPTTVFLTIGIQGIGIMPDRVKQFIGLGALKMPPSLPAKLWPYAMQALLSAPLRHGLEIVECCGKKPTQTIRYVGIHIRPKATA